MDIILSAVFMSLIFMFVGVSYFLLKPKRPHIDQENCEVSLKDSEALEMIRDAQQDAEKIITSAELESIEFTVRERIIAKELLKQYEHELHDLKLELSLKLNTQNQAMMDLVDKVGEEHSEALKTMTEKSIIEFDQMKDELAVDFQNQFRDLVSNVINLEEDEMKKTLSQARREIEQYKVERLAEIDSMIIRIVERTLEEVSHKILTPEEHKELIFSSLKKIKIEELINNRESESGTNQYDHREP